MKNLFWGFLSYLQLIALIATAWIRVKSSSVARFRIRHCPHSLWGKNRCGQTHFSKLVQINVSTMVRMQSNSRFFYFLAIGLQWLMARKYERDYSQFAFPGLIQQWVLVFHPFVTDNSQSKSRPSRSIHVGPVFLFSANPTGI